MVTTLIVDKTGTLTEGKPKLVEVFCLAPMTRPELLSLAASLEKTSEHPLADAIVRGAKAENVSLSPVDGFKSTTGKGVEGRVIGRSVVLGNQTFFTERKLSSPDLMSKAETYRKEGQTVMFVAVDDKPAGLISVADPIKESTPEAIRYLESQGIKVVMLTGDNRVTAEAIGRKIGLKDVRADVLPQDKARIVRELKESGEVVAMAGDGINDAPALAAADIGIAMGTGTDVAMESAGVTILKGDLRGIEKAHKLSQATMKNIKQNMFFAFIYNGLGVPIAAGILYPVWGILLNPMMASLAMSLSSVSVIANALRLKTVKL